MFSLSQCLQSNLFRPVSLNIVVKLPRQRSSASLPVLTLHAHWHGSWPAETPGRLSGPNSFSQWLNEASVTVASLRMSGQGNSAADATGTQARWDWFRNVGFLKVDKPRWWTLSVCVSLCACARFLSEWRNATIFLVSCLLLSDHLSPSRCLLDCCWCVWNVCVSFSFDVSHILSARPASTECDNIVSRSFFLSLWVNFNICCSSQVHFSNMHVFLLLSVPSASPCLHVYPWCAHLLAYLCLCVCRVVL